MLFRSVDPFIGLTMDLLYTSVNANVKPKELSEELEAICGVSSCTRSDVIKRVWEYIRGNDLKVEGGIKCDAAMKKVFGKSKISNTDIMGGISPHLS